MTLDVEKVRGDFPALSELVFGHRLAYLDNAATTQKPHVVLDAMTAFYLHGSANVHRGAHSLGGRASIAYEAAREKVQRFVCAASSEEIVFTKGATESVNLVANAIRLHGLTQRDQIVVTAAEHHANFVPWQRIAQAAGATLAVVPLDPSGALRMDALEALVGPRTRLVAVAHVANAIGTKNPIDAIAKIAKRQGALLFVDGAQAAPHLAIDVVALGADFYAFSAHKMYGPFGIGMLYAKREHLAWMEPLLTGGGMVDRVSAERTTFAPPPAKLEAGTPNVAGAIGFGAAIDYLSQLGLGEVEAHERALTDYAIDMLSKVRGVRLIGMPAERAAIVSFVLDRVHAHDVGTILDRYGVAIRVGNHCAQLAMAHFGVTATARASFGIYNDRDDVDALVDAIGRASGVFGS